MSTDPGFCNSFINKHSSDLLQQLKGHKTIILIRVILFQKQADQEWREEG